MNELLHSVRNIVFNIQRTLQDSDVSLLNVQDLMQMSQEVKMIKDTCENLLNSQHGEGMERIMRWADELYVALIQQMTLRTWLQVCISLFVAFSSHLLFACHRCRIEDKK
jgi:predicted RNA-binding protein with EMAP domain